MLIKHRVGTFTVVFRKKRGRSKNHNGKKVNCVITECRILLQTSPPNSQRQAESTEVFFGVSKQNGLDKYNHVVGKRLALKRALSSRKFHTQDLFPFDKSVLRDLRCHIWREFYDKFAPGYSPVCKPKDKPQWGLCLNTKEGEIGLYAKFTIQPKYVLTFYPYVVE